MNVPTFQRTIPDSALRPEKLRERASPLSSYCYGNHRKRAKRAKYALSGSYQQRMFLTSRREGCTLEGDWWGRKMQCFRFWEVWRGILRVARVQGKVVGWLLCVWVCVCSVQVGPMMRCGEGVLHSFHHETSNEQSSCWWCNTCAPVWRQEDLRVEVKFMCSH